MSAEDRSQLKGHARTLYEYVILSRCIQSECGTGAESMNDFYMRRAMYCENQKLCKGVLSRNGLSTYGLIIALYWCRRFSLKYLRCL